MPLLLWVLVEPCAVPDYCWLQSPCRSCAVWLLAHLLDCEPTLLSDHVVPLLSCGLALSEVLFRRTLWLAWELGMNRLPASVPLHDRWLPQLMATGKARAARGSFLHSAHCCVATASPPPLGFQSRALLLPLLSTVMAWASRMQLAFWSQPFAVADLRSLLKCSALLLGYGRTPPAVRLLALASAALRCRLHATRMWRGRKLPCHLERLCLVWGPPCLL